MPDSKTQPYILPDPEPRTRALTTGPFPEFASPSTFDDPSIFLKAMIQAIVSSYLPIQP